LSVVDRINKRLAKEGVEREAAYAKAAPRREEAYQRLEALLARYDAECLAHPLEITDEARNIWRHMVDVHQWDLVFFFQRTRQGKPV